jgi:hypothetical protein
MNETLHGIAQRFRALGLAALLIPLTGCGPSLNYAYMSKDSGGGQKTTKFLPLGDEIYCVMELVGGGEDTKLRFAVEGPGSFRLSDNDLFPRPDPTVQGPVDLSIQLFQIDAMGNHVAKGPWPIGGYVMDIFIDEEFEQSLDFEVVN